MEESHSYDASSLIFCSSFERRSHQQSEALTDKSGNYTTEAIPCIVYLTLKRIIITMELY